MHAPAYSLWDAIAYLQPGRQQGESPLRIHPHFFAPPAPARRALRGRRGRILVSCFIFGPMIVLGLLGLWGFEQPDGFGPAAARLGANTPRQWFNRASALYAAVLLTAFLTAGIGMPWAAVARTLRPVRRQRLWAYHAARQGRGPADFLDVLRREQEQRVALWHQRLRRGRRRAAILFAWVDPVCRQAIVAGLLVFSAWVPLVVQFMPRTEHVAVFLGCGTPLAIPVLGFVAFCRYKLALRRLIRTLEHSRCPDCGYDLFGVPPALPKDKVPGVGPARCPECGSMWPLVPPPFDIE